MNSNIRSADMKLKLVLTGKFMKESIEALRRHWKMQGDHHQTEAAGLQPSYKTR